MSHSYGGWLERDKSLAYDTKMNPALNHGGEAGVITRQFYDKQNFC